MAAVHMDLEVTGGRVDQLKPGQVNWNRLRKIILGGHKK